MTEISERAWQRRNRPWRRWLRGRFWFVTKRRREAHALKAELKRLEDGR